MKTTNLTMVGMNCDACANTIRTLAEKEPGVQMATVSYSERQTRVLFDPKSIEEEHRFNTNSKVGLSHPSRRHDADLVAAMKTVRDEPHGFAVPLQNKSGR